MGARSFVAMPSTCMLVRFIMSWYVSECKVSHRLKPSDNVPGIQLTAVNSAELACIKWYRAEGALLRGLSS